MRAGTVLILYYYARGQCMTPNRSSVLTDGLFKGSNFNNLEDVIHQQCRIKDVLLYSLLQTNLFLEGQ